MKSGAKRKQGPHNEPIVPNDISQKKQYRPPRFDVLTPDQVMAQLAKRALPGDAAAEQVLTRASKMGRVEQTSSGRFLGEAKAAPGK